MVTCYVRLARPAAADLGDIDDLDPSERLRMLRFAKLADRLRFATGRRLVRQLVAELTGRRPAEIVIRTRCLHCGSNTHGKPYAVHPGGTLPVSIAHSAERVLVTATTGPAVGADIELIDASRYHEHVLDDIQSPHERTPRTAAAFTRLWVHKEAVLKCTGEGLMRSPRSFSIDFDHNPPNLIGWAGPTAPIGLATLDVGGGYAAAVAVGGTRAIDVALG